MSSPSPLIEIGVMGCGSQNVYTIKDMLTLSSQIKIVAVYDPDPASVQELQDLIPNEVKVCANEAELLAINSISWVMIASWNVFHAQQTIAAFHAGKHVFCQKPLATNAEDCWAMFKAWQDSGKMFNIGFTLRYSPHYRKIKQILQSNTIGQIVSAEFNETLDFNHGGYIMGDWRRLTENAGSHLLEKCCHDMDLLLWMVNSDPVRVASFGGLNFFTSEHVNQAKRIGADPKSGRPAFQQWGGKVNLNPFTSDKDIYDNQVVIIEFANGVRASFHANCSSAFPERRMVFIGTEGAIRADVLTGKIEVKRLGFDTQVVDESTLGKGGHGNGDMIMAQELLDAMLKSAPPTAGLMDGLRSSLLCYAIDRAADQGQVIDLAENYFHKKD